MQIVSQLDQLYAYMLMITPSLPEPYKTLWKQDIKRIVDVLINQFFSEKYGFFWGVEDESSMLTLGSDHTDFGHSVKTLWVILKAGELLEETSYVTFARPKIDAILKMAYIKETGDLTILEEMVDFDNDPSLAQPLMEHLRRSFNYTLTHLGPHGLPLIGRADWNDCLNLNCFSREPGESFQTFGPSEGPVAESVFIAGMFVKYGREYAEICRLTGQKEEGLRADEAVEKMYQTVLDAGWDGEWFIRAYDAFREKVGSDECEEGKIYIEPQGFCVLADIGIREGHAKKALDSVKERLDTKYGIVLQQPAYTKYYVNLGEISSYPPGYKENAGIFCHNNPWVSIAETRIGRGDRAFQIYRRTCPAYIEDISEIHRTEPYVYSQMIAGKDAPKHGEAKNSWLTGTAAWTFVNVSQYILGIRPSFRGLEIDPCIPSDLEEFTVIRKYRGAEYHIHVQNPDHVQKGIRSVKVNGKPVENTCLLPSEDIKKYTVEVLMG